MEQPAILAEGLVKRFGRAEALCGVDLAVPRGKVLRLLGPNGAGKTTAVRIFTTILRPDAGRASIAAWRWWRCSARVWWRGTGGVA